MGMSLPMTSPDIPGNTYDNFTHYWHYDQPEQYDSVAHTLSFTRNLGIAPSDKPPRVDGATSDESFPRDGIEGKASRWLYTWEDLDLDIDISLGLAWFPEGPAMKNRRTTVQKLFYNTRTYTYHDFFYDQNQDLHPLSYYGPGFDGTYLTQEGDNPLMPLDYDVPPVDTTVCAGSIRDTACIRAHMWHLRGEVGPTFTRPLTSRLSVYVAPQFALEFVQARVHRRGGRVPDD